jgi:hypothetical protein
MPFFLAVLLATLAGAWAFVILFFFCYGGLFRGLSEPKTYDGLWVLYPIVAFLVSSIIIPLAGGIWVGMNLYRVLLTLLTL